MKKTYQVPTLCVIEVMQDVIMASTTENFGQYKYSWYNVE